AIDELRKAVDLAPGDTRPLTWLAYGYAMTGKKERAIDILRKLENSPHQAYVSPTLAAVVYAGLGEKDRALAALGKAVLERDTRLVIIKVDPVFDSLRSDPRFSEVLRRRGLVPKEPV
ncbi:MAG TPA: hypothetical protein VE398_06930, partial [Acidobacteriota bacterium]|nr:hypothetical protein [Acidobacteriota bacterium]